MRIKSVERRILAYRVRTKAYWIRSWHVEKRNNTKTVPIYVLLRFVYALVGFSYVVIRLVLHFEMF